MQLDDRSCATVGGTARVPRIGATAEQRRLGILIDDATIRWSNDGTSPQLDEVVKAAEGHSITNMKIAATEL
jgi:hypothetical protein